MIGKIALALFVLVFVPQTADAQWLKHPRWVRVGLICSISADAYDAVSTAYFVGRDNGLVEGNPILAPIVRSPWKLTAAKVGGGVAVNYAGLYVADKKPWLGKLILFGNCGAKLFIGARNERLQRAIDRR